MRASEIELEMRGYSFFLSFYRGFWVGPEMRLLSVCLAYNKVGLCILQGVGLSNDKSAQKCTYFYKLDYRGKPNEWTNLWCERNDQNLVLNCISMSISRWYYFFCTHLPCITKPETSSKMIRPCPFPDKMLCILKSLRNTILAWIIIHIHYGH